MITFYNYFTHYTCQIWSNILKNNDFSFIPPHKYTPNTQNVHISHTFNLYTHSTSTIWIIIMKWRFVFHSSKSIWTQNDKNLICHKKYRFCQIIWKSRKSKNKSQLLLFYSFCKSNMNKNIKKWWIFPSFCSRNMHPKTQNLQKLILPKKWTQN